jgi:hypothetical protein
MYGQEELYFVVGIPPSSPNIARPVRWGAMTNAEKVLYMLRAARRIAERSGTDRFAFVTTGQFYRAGIYLFRNEISRLRAAGHNIDSAPIEQLPGRQFRYCICED